MSVFDIAWIVFASVFLLAFSGLELAAIVTRGGTATLSAHLRRWLGIYPRKRWRIAGVAVFLGFLCWLATHITLGIWPG